MIMNLMSVELSPKQFERVSQIIYKLCGINLKGGKEALVRARLMKRLRALGMSDFNEYLRYLDSEYGQEELFSMVDVITTNKTSFFREPAHFYFLKEKILPNLKHKRLRFWTAACSSGEESFSLALLLREEIEDFDRRDILILGTDISRRMLEKAKQAVYKMETLKDVPPHLLAKYFTKVSAEPPLYQVNQIIRHSVRFAWLNLMDEWPMKGLFNVIFCRNVMIYFDRPTQQKLINRLWDLIESGGFLFVGHSEGLSAITHNFKYVKPAIYQK